MYSPGPAYDVLTCAIEQGFGNASLGGPNAGGPNDPPTTLLFNVANVPLNAASVVLTFAQKNGFPGAVYIGGTVVQALNVTGGISTSIVNPEGITLPGSGAQAFGAVHV